MFSKHFFGYCCLTYLFIFLYINLHHIYEIFKHWSWFLLWVHVIYYKDHNDTIWYNYVFMVFLGFFVFLVFFFSWNTKPFWVMSKFEFWIQNGFVFHERWNHFGCDIISKSFMGFMEISINIFIFIICFFTHTLWSMETKLGIMMSLYT